MKRKRLFYVAAALLLSILISGILFGQSLLDNPYHQKANELQRQAEAALENGEYDQSYELALKAKDYTALSELYGRMMYNRYKAYGLLRKAGDRISYAEGIEANVNFPANYSRAKESYRLAQELFSQGEAERKDEAFVKSADTFVRSGERAEDVLAALSEIRVVIKEPEPEPEPVPVVLPKSEPVEVYPKYYKVRLIENRRDCFWRIAEYSFAYGDPTKWPILYELNKDKLRDPGNPHLIHPGQLIEIPSINGEKREGVYDPSVTYPVLK